VLPGLAAAREAVPLTDAQLDKVTAGFDFFEIDVQNTSVTAVLADLPYTTVCSSCYLQVKGTTWGAGTMMSPAVQSLQVLSQFGP